MASFTPQNPPTNLTMLDVNSMLNSLGGPAKQCRFAVRIVPVGTSNMLTSMGYGAFMRDLTYMCEATELPGRGFDIAEARYYGPGFNRPRNTKYSAGADFTFVCRQESFERQLFDDWMEIINPTNIFDFNYAKDYMCQIDVFQLAEYPGPTSKTNPTEPKAVYAWTLHDCWPMLVNPQPVTWADTDILRLSVTFAYRYWSRKGRDTDASGGEVVLSPNP